MKKIEVSELQGPLTEFMQQLGGENGRKRFDEFKLWLKNVTVVVIQNLIDLSSPCRLPFDGAERVSPPKPLPESGDVKFESRDGDLYLDGKKLELFLSEKQKGGKVIGGHDLREELEARGGNVSAKVLDHLVDYPQMWPESWKKDTQGNTIYVFFWDDIFRNSFGRLCVRCGFWYEGKVVSSYRWLGDVWNVISPSASLAS